MLHRIGLQAVLIGAMVLLFSACAHRVIERPQNTILFDLDSAELTYSAGLKIAELAHYLEWHRSYHVILKGHADSTGTDAYNLNLSQRRAEAVRNGLIAQGVAPNRIETLSYGESLPVADNSSTGGRSLNRRVQIVLITNQHSWFRH